MIEPIVNSEQTGEHIPEQQTFEQTQSKRNWFSWLWLTKPRKRTANQGVNTKLEVVNKPSHGEFASLAKLETGLQWGEHLIHILTPRLLVLGFVLSMVDLLTHGSLLAIPGVMYAWAIVQAMAVDATLPNMWRLAWTRFDERRYVAGSILLAIGVGLGLVVFAALSIQFLQQAENRSLEQAMSQLGVNPELLTYVRSSSVVLLAAVLSVLNRTKRSKPVNNSEQPTELPQFTGEQRVNSEPNTELLQFTSKPGKVLRLDVSKQERIRQLLTANPTMTVTELAAAVGVSKGYASQQRARWRGDA